MQGFFVCLTVFCTRSFIFVRLFISVKINDDDDDKVVRYVN